MSVLNPSQLQKLRYSCQRWLTVLKNDMNLLDGTGYASSLLSVENLGDVEITSLSDNDVLRYDLASGKWKNVYYGFLTTTTTSSTTTTTSSTTSTTSTTTSTTSSTSSSTSTSSTTSSTTTTTTTTTAPPPPTEFVCEVGPGQADYTDLYLWDNGCGCDLTSPATVVLGHGGIVGAVEDQDPVEGQTSGATGTCIHATDTQILISVSSGTFQNGEQIFVDEDTNYVESNTAPNSVIAVAEMGTTGAALTTKWELDGWTTSATNYLVIRAQAGHEAQVPLDTGRFYFNFTVASGLYPSCLLIAEDYVRIENIQFKFTITAASGDVVGLNLGHTAAFTSNSHDIRIENCVFRCDGAYTGNVWAVAAKGNGGSIKIKNCVLDGAKHSAGSAGFYLSHAGSNPTYLKFYNNTIYDCTYGIKLFTANSWIGKNNLVDSCGTACFTGTYSGWDYNFSSDATAPGAHSVQSGTADFDDTGTGDFHIGASSDALNAGIGPGSDSEVSSTDVDGDTRSGSTCDIGTDEYTP